MPSQFMRFRYLNGSGQNTQTVEYDACNDKAGAAPIYSAAPVPPSLADDEFVTSVPPGTVYGVRSVLVKEITVDANKTLTNWLLTSEFQEEDSMQMVEITVTPTTTADVYLATALMFFNDTTFEQEVRFFP